MHPSRAFIWSHLSSDKSVFVSQCPGFGQIHLHVAVKGLTKEYSLPEIMDISSPRYMSAVYRIVLTLKINKKMQNIWNFKECDSMV